MGVNLGNASGRGAMPLPPQQRNYGGPMPMQNGPLRPPPTFTGGVPWGAGPSQPQLPPGMPSGPPPGVGAPMPPGAPGMAAPQQPSVGIGQNFNNPIARLLAGGGLR